MRIFYVLFSLGMMLLSSNFGSSECSLFELIHLSEWGILSLRLTEISQAFLSGGLISFSGYFLQKLLKNPLADPFILGISSGAVSFGSLYQVFIGYSLFGIYLSFSFPLFIFFTLLGCIFAFTLLLLLSHLMGTHMANSFIISGVIINSLFMSSATLLTYMFEPSRLYILQNAAMGYFSDLSPSQLFFIYLTSFLIMFKINGMHNTINIYELGTEFAHNHGIKASQVLINTLTLIAVLVTLSVVISGIISYLAIIVPFFVRRYGVSLMHQPIHCFFLGGIFLCFCHLLSKLSWMGINAPLGVFVSVFGTVCVIVILFKMSLEPSQKDFT